MAYYPLNTDLKDQMTNFDKGNFSLWYNKFIPLSSESQLHPCDNSGVKDKCINLYKNKYHDFYKNLILKEKLTKKHTYQMHYCNICENSGYKTITIKAKLLTPLVLGIGESHPSETSIVFDRTLGIPYIPASSIKGINRYSRSVEYVLESENIDFSYDKPDEKSLIPLFFGSQTKKGDIVFLDAYPVNLPELKEDIMNPHYRGYYGNDNNKEITPPSDTENPVPIKFLAVKEGAEFVFRILYRTEKTVSDSKEQIKEKITNFFKRSLTKEGIGAKTSLGYGHFEILGYSEPSDLINSYKTYLAEFMTEEEKFQKKVDDFVSEVKTFDKSQQSQIDSKFNEWRKDEEINELEEIAKAFLPLINKKKSKGDFTQQYLILKEILKLEESSEKVEKETPETSQPQLTKKEQTAQKKIEQIIKKGCVTKRELRNLREFKNTFPDLYEQISNLPVK
jgi:CRISPR-associated protein Cmr6